MQIKVNVEVMNLDIENLLVVVVDDERKRMDSLISHRVVPRYHSKVCTLVIGSDDSVVDSNYFLLRDV